MVAAFGQQVVRAGGFDEAIARTLRSLFERRNEADCVGVAISLEEAEAAVGEAERFVNAVEDWIRQR